MDVIGFGTREGGITGRISIRVSGINSGVVTGKFVYSFRRIEDSVSVPQNGMENRSINEQLINEEKKERENIG